MEFENLSEIKHTFIMGDFNFPKEMIVSEIKYKIRHSSSYSIEDMITKKFKAMWIYTTTEQPKAHARGLDQWLVFLWGFTPKLRMLPYDVRPISKARVEGRTIIEQTDPQQKDNVIGSVVQVRLTNIPGSANLKGKIDTGADISSLHATEYKINGDQVSFKCPEISQNVITIPLVNQQAVKSADGGVEYRPVIKLNIKVNEKLINDALFNLNDRGKMQYPILIGKNILKSGGFMIDPRMDESDDVIDWDLLQETFKDDVIEEQLVEKVQVNEVEVKKAYDMLLQTNVSLADVIRHIRTDVTNVLTKQD
jgi:hypothetical protein